MLPAFGNLLPQGWQPRGGRVFVMTIFHRLAECLDGDVWWLEVRLAKTELHSVIAGHVKHPPNSRRTDAICSRRESHHDLRTSG